MGRRKEKSKKPRLTDREKDKIEGLHLAGYSTRQIQDVIGRRARTVRRITNPTPPKPSKRVGRLPRLSERVAHRLVRTAPSGDSSAAKLKDELKLSVSVRTIQSLLEKVDWLIYAKVGSTLPLSAENKLARKQWATTLLLRQDVGSVWETIIFSDERKWNLDGSDGFHHYWHDLRQPPRRSKRRQMGGGSVMVWGTFSAYGKSELIVLSRRQNSDDYINTVSEYLLPFAHWHYGTGFIYQQDNASVHVSQRSMDFFREQDVALLDWPSKSPDFNPIDNL